MLCHRSEVHCSGLTPFLLNGILSDIFPMAREELQLMLHLLTSRMFLPYSCSFAGIAPIELAFSSSSWRVSTLFRVSSLSKLPCILSEYFSDAVDSSAGEVISAHLSALTPLLVH